MQCRALRESYGWTQPQLADAAGMSQPRISEIERPGERKLNLETLLRLASAFDVALQVRFVTFEKLVDDENQIDLDNFYVAPFEQNIEQVAKHEEQMRNVFVLKKKSNLVKDLCGSEMQFAQKDATQEQLEDRANNKPIYEQLIGAGVERLSSIAS
jgi:transcriptional regulator with XRE-family HTH domain